jgi:hypothetical protein
MELTAEDKASFKTNGYLVKNDTLTETQINAGVDEIWNHIEADRDDPASWVEAGPIFPKCGDSKAMLDTLYDSPVYGIAEQLVGEGLLTRPNSFGPKLNFPTREAEWSAPGGHLDGYYTPTNGVPEGTVGRFFVGVTMYLSHQHPQGGGFTVWPGTHLQAAEYFKHHSMLKPKGGNVRDVFDLPDPVEITGPPGTVCFWHGSMVHSASKNCRPDIRMCMITRLSRLNQDDTLFEFPENPWEYWPALR